MNIGIIISLYGAITGLIIYVIKITADYVGMKKDLQAAIKDISELKNNGNSLIRLEENIKYLKDDMQKIERKLDQLLTGKNAGEKE